MDQIDEIYKERVQTVLPDLGAPKNFKGDKVPSRIEEGLFLGSVTASNNKPVLKSLNITHILTVASHIPPASPDDFTYKVIDVDDREDTDLAHYFDECIDFIVEAKRSGGGVLVHCFVGKSRSATIVLAYLIKVRSMTLTNAFKYVRSKRRVASPNVGFIRQLQGFEQSLQAQNSSS